MTEFLAQLILARRSEDAEKWTNILFVVVLAVFWALSGILKTRAKKAKQGEGAGSPRAPSRGRPAQSRAVPPRPPRSTGVGQARSRLAELRAAAEKFAAEAEQAFRVQIGAGTQPAPPPLQAPTAQEPPVESPMAAMTPGTPAPKPVSAPAYLPALLKSYADPDQLRRAILHYEILGKPLALREPQDFVGEL